MLVTLKTVNFSEVTNSVNNTLACRTMLHQVPYAFFESTILRKYARFSRNALITEFLFYTE